MLAKITSKNQITLPKAVLAQLPAAEYYEVQAEGGRIVLTPVQVTRLDQVWDKLEALGITDRDVEEAVQWARRHTGDEKTAPVRAAPARKRR